MKHIQFLVAFFLVVLFAACKDVVTSNEQKNIDVSTTKFLLLASPTTDFGVLRIGTVKAMRFPIRDTDKTRGATITGATITGADEANFTLVTPSVFPQHMAAGDTISVEVKFAPTRAGIARAVLGLTIVSDTATYTLYDSLIASGATTAGGGLCVSVSSVDCGAVLPDTTNGNGNGPDFARYWVSRTLKVTNCSNSSIVFTNDSVGGGVVSSISCDNAAFRISFGYFRGDHSSLTLNPNDTLTVTVRFAPTHVGNFSGILNITDSAHTVSAQVPLTGSSDLNGYPRSAFSSNAYDSNFVVLGTVGKNIDSTFWLRNNFPFPLTLNWVGAEGNAGRPDLTFLVPRVDYSVWPATIASGDSLAVEFVLLWPASGNTTGAQCKIGFKELSAFYFGIVGRGK